MSELKILKFQNMKFAKARKKIDIRPFILVIVLIVLWIIFDVLTKGTFLQPRNISTLFRQMSLIAIIAVGMVLLIVAGHIDLSVGSIVAFTGAVSAILQVKFGMNTFLAIILPILIGIAFAAFNGFFAAFCKIPPFIVTLASMQLFRSGTLFITKSETISGMNNSFRVIGEGYVSNLFGIVIACLGIAIYLLFEIKSRQDKKKKNLDTSSASRFILKMVFIPAFIFAFTIVMNLYHGIPVPVIILIVATLVIAFISIKTRFGRRLYAIGGNADAAKLSGINIKKEVMKIYLVVGALSAISGLILTARLDAATSSAGTSFEFSAISAAIIGGTSFAGGEGTVFGALIGSLIMASLTTGMSLLNVQSYWQGILNGAVLLVAVWIDILARNKDK